jgi:hypothetical protein
VKFFGVTSLPRRGYDALSRGYVAIFRGYDAHAVRNSLSALSFSACYRLLPFFLPFFYQDGPVDNNEKGSLWTIHDSHKCGWSLTANQNLRLCRSAQSPARGVGSFCKIPGSRDSSPQWQSRNPNSIHPSGNHVMSGAAAWTLASTRITSEER